MFTVKDGARDIVHVMKTGGFEAYLVGGGVRDTLLGKTPEEWDITTSALPAQVMKLFPKVVPTGIDYGTVTVILPDGQYEVTTFRADEVYVDGRHPSNVVFTADLHKDLSRRDFTINAIACDPESGRLIDDFRGQEDLKAKLIRAVGDPVARFREDGLRPIRACRFAATLKFTIEPATLAAIRPALLVVQKVAPERIHDELIKILSADQPSVGFEYMRQTGLLELILPELAGCYGVEQPPQFHPYNVYWHSLYSCDAAPKDDPTLRLAALLHDIGKPSCKVDFTFYNHDRVGAGQAEALLRRLKFSNDTIEKVKNLIGNHMFDYTPEWSDAAVRRFIRRVGGIDNVRDLFLLRRADAKAMNNDIGVEYLAELQQRIDRIIAEAHALRVTDLKVDGQDVMKTLAIKPGPKVGQVLEALLEKVLDDPQLNEREKLIELIKSHA